MKKSETYLISENDLDGIIRYEVIKNKECNDEGIKKILDTTAMCDGFNYNDEDIDIRIAVIRLEVSGWK